MTYELRDNSGSAFKNRKKNAKEHPDLTGEVKVDGVIYWLSVWVKTDKNGNPWHSLSLKKKDFSEAKKAAHSEAKSNAFVDDSEIPF